MHKQHVHVVNLKQVAKSDWLQVEGLKLVTMQLLAAAIPLSGSNAEGTGPPSTAAGEDWRWPVDTALALNQQVSVMHLSRHSCTLQMKAMPFFMIACLYILSFISRKAFLQKMCYLTIK